MKIENQQDLEKLIKLLRKTGVESAKFGEIELRLGSEPPLSKYKRKQGASEPAPQSTEQYTEEEILMWSSTPPGMPDPEN